jgi:cobalamin 5'-phosphate synthase/cobalamin synthase
MPVLRRLMLAVSFLTVCPVPGLRSAAPEDLPRSTVFYPLVGAILGGVLWLILWLFEHMLPHGPAAAVALAVYTGLTGAMHVDGWMDTADALGSRRPRDEALSIMRDSRVGAVGAAAGILLMLGKWSSLAVLPADPAHVWTVLAVPSMSRWGMVWSMRLAPYARGRARGLGAAYAGTVPVWAVATGALVPVACLELTRSPGFALAMVCGAVVLTLLFTLWMRRRFGGMTGDTYGALNELLEWWGWLAAPALT